MSSLLIKYLRNFPIDYGKNRLAKYAKLPTENDWISYTNGMGVTFNLDLKEYQMKQIYLYDLYERNTILQLKKLINKISKENITIVDVGANIGFYSLTLEAFCLKKKCTVHAFEPNPYTFGLLKNNIKKNNKNNIKLNQIGLSNKKSSFTLTYNELNLGTASFYSKTPNADNIKKVEIDTITLDAYCAENNIENIDILKVDIEGAELSFLQGSKEILSKSKNCILIVEIVDENCKRAGYSAMELFKFITNLGFEPYLPKSFPFPLKKVTDMPSNYHDNIIFIKNNK